MKKLIAVTALCILAATQVYSQGSTVARKLLISLQPDEEILTAESCIALIFSNDQVNLTTMVDDKYFVYKNGQRTGPFDSFADLKPDSPCADNNNLDNKCSIYQTADLENNADYLSMNDDGTFSINLNNKKYGPYTMIVQLHVWPDKSGFVAIAMDKDMNSTLITSEGLKVSLKGDAETIKVSPKGKNFIIAYTERPAVDMSVLNMDFSKMTQEEMIKFAKAQEEKAKNAPKPVSYVLFNGTSKFGPFPPSTFYSNNPGFTKTGGGNWIMTVNGALYINGVKTKEFTDMDVSTCKTYLSADGKRYAVVSYNKIYFNDGKTYENPLESAAVEKDGKVTLKWLCLENEKDLVLYSRDL